MRVAGAKSVQPRISIDPSSISRAPQNADFPRPPIYNWIETPFGLLKE